MIFFKTCQVTIMLWNVLEMLMQNYFEHKIILIERKCYKTHTIYLIPLLTGMKEIKTITSYRTNIFLLMLKFQIK